jgi:hypothetical protein
MIEKIIIFIINIFLFSCHTSEKVKDSQIVKYNLKILPKITNVKLSELGFKDIEYIPLESNGNNIISGTNEFILGNKIIVGNHYYLIKYFNTILKFQDDGHFVCRIGTEGRGPNEFTVAHDADIEEKSQNIYLLAGWQNKIFVYTEGGSLISSIRVPYSTDFNLNGDKVLCYSGNNMGNIENSYNYLDKTGSVLKSFQNRYPFENHYGNTIWEENIFYRFDNKLFKKEVYSDTIYEFENMRFKPHLIIDVGEKLLTPKARSDNDGLALGSKYIDPLKLFEFGDYIYYEFIYRFVLPEDVLIYSFIGSKKGNFQVLINSGQGIINDLDGGPNILPKTIKDDSTIIALVEANDLKKHVASEDFKNSNPIYLEKKRELEQLANKIKETDNPVLVLLKLKK